MKPCFARLSQSCQQALHAPGCLTIALWPAPHLCRYQPQLGDYRQSVWLTMTHSDEFKPGGISATSNIK
jgi:hypothetical protein